VDRARKPRVAESLINEAIKLLADNYRRKPPAIILQNKYPLYKSGNKKVVGLFTDDNNIWIIRPLRWKGTFHSWSQTLIHEMAHFLTWNEMERMVDDYAWNLVKNGK
jgi:hypothetical protein